MLLKTLEMLLPKFLQFKIDAINSSIPATNLKEGSGAPWAGQRRDSSWAHLLVNVELSDSCENFGLVPPIGSKIE